MLMKTKTVSEQLNVNPSTIQRWVKHFDLPCHRNSHGHLLFNEKDVDTLKQIKKQLDHGLSMEDVELYQNQNPTPKESGIGMEEYEKKMGSMVSRINGVEKSLAKKADEVVTYQLYQHRHEIDDLTKTIQDVELRLNTVETQLSALHSHSENKKSKDKAPKSKPKRNWLVSIFSN